MLVDLESVFFIHTPHEVWDLLLNTNITIYWVHEPTRLWLIPSMVPLHWRVTFSLDQIIDICTIDYFMFLSPVGSFGYSGCYLLIFPDTSSITCFHNFRTRQSWVPYTVSLYCSMLGFLNLGSLDIWGWIALCCGRLSCLLTNLSSILGSTHEIPVAAPELWNRKCLQAPPNVSWGAKLYLVEGTALDLQTS